MLIQHFASCRQPPNLNDNRRSISHDRYFRRRKDIKTLSLNLHRYAVPMLVPIITNLLSGEIASAVTTSSTSLMVALANAVLGTVIRCVRRGTPDVSYTSTFMPPAQTAASFPSSLSA